MSFMKKMQYTLPVSLSAVAYAAVRSRQSIRCSSTGSIWRDANPNSPRASPYPLVFIRTPENWGEDAKEWQSTQGLLIEKGFGCLEIFCDEHKGSTSKEILKKMADDVQQRIRLAAIPFPPVLFAKGMGTLITETHISDYPVSGVVLINPPYIDGEKSPNEKVLPSPVETFNYEAFPRIAVMDQLKNVEQLEQHRLADSDADLIMYNGEYGQKQSLYEIERWLDDKGF
ncbi:hypothetical protein E3P81_00467 [Wallemia ichthyophaga]|nr:hypothetical protein E3P97_00469 [Wallemia ichthyophaga]TIB06408.1 hypothetical protein E3P96_00480 [Wallemia ichthyophaga]TIB32369.1 hypothetical protein E3P85_01894 [Wallemia ichthyophaga]TIB50234.1 hypothetical protein E3P82_00567 [Wallemia ichthyophaga]TIB53995.1 hypothetical protein E3P81_00467 [Wallemia ichthyophaga]